MIVFHVISLQGDRFFLLIRFHFHSGGLVEDQIILATKVPKYNFSRVFVVRKNETKLIEILKRRSIKECVQEMSTQMVRNAVARFSSSEIVVMLKFNVVFHKVINNLVIHFTT